MPYRLAARPVRRHRGMGDILTGNSVDAYGNISSTFGGPVVGTCSQAFYYLLTPQCWANSITQWAQMAGLQSPANMYVPPLAPSDVDVQAAVDSGAAQNLIDNLISGSTLGTQAANSAASQAVPNNPVPSALSADLGILGNGCDPGSDPLSCPLGMSTYLLAAIAIGGIFLFVTLKR